MAEPYIGEIKMVGFNFAPRNYATCDGQLLPIAQNTALFSLLGVNYGGNGQTTFGLPNLQGCAPMHWGNGPGLSPHVIGETSGTQTVTLTTNQIPPHQHSIPASSAGANSQTPSTFASAVRGTPAFYAAAGGTPVTMALTQAAGGNQPHDNMQPYLSLIFVIALFGVFPARN